MQFHVSTKPFQDLQTEALIVPLLSDVAPDRVRGFDRQLAGLIGKLNNRGDWRGKAGEVALFYPDHLPQQATEPVATGIKRYLLTGMGAKADWDYERLRQAIASALKLVKKRQLSDCTIVLPPGSTPATAKDLATIVVMTNYEFSHYQTLERETPRTQLEQVNFWIADSKDTAVFQDAITRGNSIGQAVIFARDLANHPANVMTPRHLADDALALAGPDVKVTIFGRDDLTKMGMGAILAVARGSAEEPQLIVADYRPQLKKSEISASPVGGRNPPPPGRGSVEAGKFELPTVALVGKGITFDSGGISIKPSEGMHEMKIDMAGAATCLGVIAAAKALALPIRIVAILPTTENLPGGQAIKPGDIITAYDGKTIEILNTDAEGRVVLADGLAYAAKDIQPDAVIDVATLTGAAIVAFGHEITPLFGNNESLFKKLEAAARRTGERVWRMPLIEEYKKGTRSDIADVQNIGLGRRNAALATSAAFLSFFVPDDLPWAHLDIAGPAILEKANRPYLSKGGSGWGVRLLIDFFEHWIE